MQTMRALKDGVWALHSDLDVTADTDAERQAYVTGQCIGPIDRLVPAAEIVVAMYDEAIRILRGEQPNFSLSRL